MERNIHKPQMTLEFPQVWRIFGGAKIVILISVPNGDNPNHATGVDINRNFDFLWSSGINTVNKNETNSSETYEERQPSQNQNLGMLDSYLIIIQTSAIL